MKETLHKLLESVYGNPVRIEHSRSTGGGSINQTQILELSNGESVFMKYHANPPEGFFAAEAKGLELLRQPDHGPRVPKPLAVEPGPDPKIILIEYVEETRPEDGFVVGFARALAHLHRTTQDHYGLDHDNYIGSTVQKNHPEADGIVFFREHRLRFQQNLARESGKLPVAVDKRLDKLCDKLQSLLDLTGETPALLHGDLWSGNFFADPGQAPCIFDPAVYYGLREADLAMTELFGRLPQSFYDAYHSAFPLNPGYATRKKLYNLYHLLNHLNLFGRSYLSQVEATVNHFVR